MKDTTQLAALGLFAARVPRYTSYPTAPHFSDAVGADQHASWIRAIPAGGEISLYVHIPFCRRLCWFCACRTQGTSTAAPLTDYLKRLRAEIALIKTHLAPGVTLRSLHWGGGTPTLLPPEMITELAEMLFELAPLAENAEFSVEIDPSEVDAPRIEALARAGMTRASIGVQDFDPEIQATIGREQSFEITHDTTQMLRAAGVRSLNMDILYGLPHQTPARVTDSVQKVLSMAPDRVALFGYAHVPWMARRQSMIPTEALPAPRARLDLFETARQLFVWDDYAEVGIDHFAKPEDSMARAQQDGSLRRNFQGYTVDPAPVLLGIGASAISRFPQGYTQNAPATGAWAGRIDTGTLATHRGHAFTGDDLLRGALIEDLMCFFEIDRDRITARTGASPSDIDALVTAVDPNLRAHLTPSQVGWRLETAPQALARLIAHQIDAYRTPDDVSFSSAI